MSVPKLVKDQPFISRSELSGHWYFVRSWRPQGNGHTRVAHEKFDITEQIENLIADVRAGDL